MYPSFLNVFFLDMSSACYYSGLKEILFAKNSPYIVSRLKSIHDGHTTIHKDKTIRVLSIIKSFFNVPISLESIICLINKVKYTLKPRLLENNFHTQQVVRLIINNQDPPVFHHSFSVFNHLILVDLFNSKL